MTAVAPANALAADLQRRPGHDVGPHAGMWLAVANALASAADVPALGAHLTAVRDASGRAAAAGSVLHDFDAAIGSAAEHVQQGDADAASVALRSAISLVEDAGALALADAMLEGLQRVMASCSAVEQGRVLAQRARVARQLGETAVAESRYECLLTMSRRERSRELEARARVGFGVLALMRGNLPQADAQFARAAAAIDAAPRMSPADGPLLRDVATAAHHGCMIVAGRRGDTSRAVVEGWLAFEHASGDALREAEMLANVGGVMLDAAEYQVAFDALSAAVKRCNVPRILLPALGGAAVAAAALRRQTDVRANADRIQELAADAANPYVVADALLSAGCALQAIGHDDAAVPLLRRAHRISGAHAFHELALRAEAALDGMTAAATPAQRGAAWTAEATAVFHRVKALHAGSGSVT